MTRSYFYLSFFLFLVPKHGECIHADLQSDLHDAAGGPLVGLSAVSSPNVTGIPL